jgi:tRNA threonylcarbamoyladenosine biosynthesis protein TsaE
VYRLGSLNELEDLDLFEESREGVLIIEWGNAVASAMPEDHLHVEIDVTGPDERVLRLVAHGAWQARSLKEMVE